MKKASEPDPHLHIHVRPRYDKPVMVNGCIYTDSEFGHHYAVNKCGTIPVKDKEEIKYCKGIRCPGQIKAWAIAHPGVVVR